jgi:cobalamin 5'-phosphate synthase/cobalamin synthase
MLGAIYAAAAALMKDHLPLSLVAVLLVTLDAIATGALHFDGLADMADGFGGGKTREDILRIMRDHTIGSYGGLALAIVVAFKVTAYAALLQQSGWVPALILAPALGRWSILLLTARLPYARQAPSPIDSMGKASLIWGTATILAAAIAAQSFRAGIALAAVIIVSAVFGLYCRRRIGGITGDTLGANLQLCESVTLLVFLWSRAR